MESPSHSPGPSPVFSFSTSPDRYRHLRLSVSGGAARLVLSIREDEPFRPGYVLKMNSYDLGVDLELADAIQRLRFEHPEVRVVVVTSDRDRVFCSGANIHMLASSTHPFKVNFCKFTNETRLSIEDASTHSGQKYLCAVSGACAGGGYELALACDDIVLIDDGSSTVSLPEVPLLGVLPGTGGLTRVVDKRMVRRDHADVFSTLAEGIKGKRAVEWRLVDAVAPRSRFADVVAERAKQLAAKSPAAPAGPGIHLDDVDPVVEGNTLRYRHVTVLLDPARRLAELTMHAPEAAPPATLDALVAAGASLWALRAFRELDDALLRLRFHHEELGLIVLKTRGDAAHILASDRALAAHADHWFVREVRLLMARTLRRLDATARSIFAVVDEGSAFAGSLLELVLAADRSYMLDAPGVTVHASELTGGALPMTHGPSRLALRFLHSADRAREALATAQAAPLAAADAERAGIITLVADDIDFADEVRIAIEERVSMSPDALTGMEANLRFAGVETADTKIFGRLSAWQNWIFIRPNATGDRGALTMYGRPERPQFDLRRT
ncbi:MAG: benzoyl-CoA-dihydrodiol lyase [Myxococcales bacterium]|nr:benzoyl-CoA-dihydrodiol lyase [Myxococcales bacterium]